MANSARFNAIQAKLAALPGWWILCTLIQDYMQNIFRAPVFHPAKVVLMGFATLFKTLLAYCHMYAISGKL